MMRASALAAMESVGGEPIILEEVCFDATVEDLMAEVAVIQSYRNPGTTSIEAVYTFPLPADGVLLDFEVEIGDRRLAGVVVEKKESERRYEDAITDGDAAVLLEQAGPGLYTASVGNLLPGETARIRFRYGLLLRWNGDRVRFSMPTTIAPRYGDPGSAGLAPHQVPYHSFDAERAFGFRIALRGMLADARLNSPTHDVGVASETGQTIVTLNGKPAMDRDFVLEAHLVRKDAAGAFTAPDVTGWVALASFRPEITSASERRCVKIVVDCSGSMAGDSIAQAKMGLERILDNLRPADLFDIIAFGGRPRALFSRETPVSEATLAAARRFVRALNADMGGTEIGAAMEAAYGFRNASDLPHDLLLITDGEVWKHDEIIAGARRSGYRHFTVGVGSAVAEGIIRGLAEATGGACEFVTPREDMGERIHRHFQRMYAPSAANAIVRWPFPAAGNFPHSIETVHGGDTVHVFAWFPQRPAGEAILEITLADGRVLKDRAPIRAMEDESSDWPSATDTIPSVLARVAAARQLFTIGDDKAGTDLALRYQLMSRWTNYLVVHVRADADKTEDLPKIVRVPQVLAAGWHGTGTVLASQAFSGKHVALDKPAVSASVCYDRAPTVSLRCSVSGFERRAVISGADPLVARLNAKADSSLPSLEDLADLGVPENVLAMLRDLVDRGTREAVVVAAFLHVLTESDARNAFDREMLRYILKAWKTAMPDRSVMDAVTRAFDAW